MDYDGDGAHDLLIVEKQYNAPEPMRVSIRGQVEQEATGLQLLAPDGFIEIEDPFGGPPAIVAVDHGELVRTIDVNGDGQFDVFQMTADNTFHLSIQTSPPVDLLESVTDGLGAVSSVSYASLAELAAVGRYSRCTYSECNPFSGCRESDCWMGPMTVVASQTLPERSGDNTRILHSYGAVQADPFAGFGGFAWHTAYDEGTGTTARTDYEQADYTDAPPAQRFAKLGRVKEQVAYTPLGDGTWFASTTRTTYKVVETVAGTYAVYPEETVSKVYEGTQFNPSTPTSVFFRTDVPFTSSVRVVNTFDAYGTAKTIEVDRGGGYTTRIDRPLIENRDGPWLVGLVKTETTTSRTPNAGEKTRRIEIEYDDWGQVQDVYRQKGEEGAQHVHYERDSRGLVERATVTARNAAGQEETRETTTQYDVHGIYPHHTTNSLGHAVDLTWEPLVAAVDTVTDVANGLTTSFDYDEFGRTTFVQNPDGSSATTLYGWGIGIESFGVKTTPTNGPATSVMYDRVGRVVRRELGVGPPTCEPSSSSGPCSFGRPIESKISYDAVGRVEKITPPYFFVDVPTTTIEYEYDAVGRVRKMIGADGSTFEYRYEPFAVETRNEDCASPTEAAPCEKRRTELDAQGRVARTLRYPDGVSGLEMRYEYGPFDVLEKVIDQNENVVRQVHDALGRRTELHDPDIGLVVTAWDGFDQVASVTRGRAPNLIAESYAYDVLGRLARRSAPDGVDEFDYDVAPGKGIGKIAAMHRGDVSESYAYDDKGRLSQIMQVVDGESFVTDLGYDELGRPLTTAFPAADGDPIRFTLERRYSKFHELREISANTGTSCTIDDDCIWSGIAARCEANQCRVPVWTLLDRNERFQPTLEQLGNALVTSSTYDSLTGRLEQVSTNIRYTPHLAAYQYSASGKVLSRTMRTTGAPHAEADHVETYRYDGAGRLVNAANRSSNDWFGFDPLDNLTSSTDSFLAGCTLTYGQGAVLPHALTGMSCGGVERPLTYDELGRVRSYFDGNSQAEIQYTSFDKPLEVKNSSGKIRYTYGADHRAVKKEPVETYIPEPRFNGRAGAWMTNLFLGDYERRTSPGRTEHVYSVRVGGKIVAQRYWRSVGGTSREEWRYLHTDALGSPERTTSFSGDIVELYSFDPWGVLRSWAWDGNPGVAVPPDTNIGFTGHRIDYETGLIDAIGRTYNPTYKRFLTPDPFVQNPGDGATFNRFAYVQNDPVGRIDPTGFQSVDGFPIISVSSGGGATISAGGVVGSVAGWFVLSVGAIANAFSGGGDDRPPSEPRGTWLRPDASAAGGSDAVRLGGAHSAANRIADAVASGASLGGPRDLVAGEQASSGGEWGGEDFQRRVLDVLNAATPVNDAYIDGLSGITEWRRGTLKMRASPWAWGRLYNRATTGTPLGHVIETAVKDAPGAQDNAVSAVLPMGGGTRRVLGRVGREAFGTTTFRGLIQNRPLRELTHNEVYRAFAETGWTPSNHAIGRLLEYRTGAVGIETLNDVARVLNNGVVTSAGRGLYSIGLGRFEAIINSETRVIVTFSPL